MTALLTLTDDTYSANNGDGRKRLYANISFTNPYSAGGELITQAYFGTKFDGARVIMVNPSVAAGPAAIAATGCARGDNASTAAFLLQFWNASTSTIGGLVDNTVNTASWSSVSVFVEMIGR